MDEVRRQRALLDAIAGGAAEGLREAGTRGERGLAAYRANADASAERALTAAFPTVRTLVGVDDFARLAREFWRDQPPQRGDLGEWGEGFAGWLAAHPALSGWPYLADSARLDLALHRCERAADAVFDAASLARLESIDPARLTLRLVPGTALVRSRWPIVALHAAHQLDGPAALHAFEALRAAIAAPRAEDALVVRQGWRAVVEALAGAELRFTAALLDEARLDRALEEAGPAFDFAAWLARAIRGGWLRDVAMVGG